jgi:DNA-binding beta-propeller fold protein YncE
LYLIACREKKPGAAGGPLTKGATIDIPRERAAYVTNNKADSVSVIDRDGTAVKTVPVDIDRDAREAPHHIAVDSASGNAFVALAFPSEPGKKKDPHASHGTSADTGKLARLDLATLAVQAAVDVDENPGDVVLTHDRKRVLVTHFDMKRAMDVAARGGASPATMFASLVVLDAKTLARLGTRPVCVAPHGVATTRDDRTAFIACYGSDELAIVDLASEGFPVSRVPLGAAQGVPGVPRYGPYSATLSPDESLVVLADLEGKDLRVYDRNAKKLVADKTITLDAKAFMPAFVGPSTLIVPLQAPDGIARVDVAAAKIEVRTTYAKADCALPHAARAAKDGRVYVVCEGDHAGATGPGTVLEIDPKSLELKKKWNVGAYPDGLAFGDDG